MNITLYITCRVLQAYSFYLSLKYHVSCTLNPFYIYLGSITFGSDTVEFAGFVITPTDIQPSDKQSAQSVTFLRHKTSLISDLGLASSTKYRTATPSATTWRLFASISSRRQRSIGMISFNKFLSNQRLLYWSKSPRVSGYSTPNVSHVSPQIGPRKASVFGSCRSTARVRSSLLSVAQRDGK